MDLKTAVVNSLTSGNPVVLTKKLKIIASHSNQQVKVNLLSDNSLVWTDSNTLDNIVADLESEFHNFK